ncbi:dermokine isoform 8 precursor [Daubentonia madagascariensis]|uniref:Dermokine isoform 8 n=1 Tax=Daubentonia madagascariensis TaxID=31869 RepID=A0ABD2D7P0_DAUMA
MKLQGSLACLLLALCLGSGEAGPLQGGGGSAGTSVGEAVGHGMGDAISHGVGQAIGEEAGGAVGSGVREASGPGMADTLGHEVGEAAHALGSSGSEAGRQAGNIIQHGADAVHSSWQGMPGSSSAWGTSGGHGMGNPGGSGTPWGHGYPGGPTGTFGTNAHGGSWGQGGNGVPPNFGTNVQGAVAQPGYDATRGSSQNTGCTNPPPSGSGGSSSDSGGSNTGSSPGSSSGSGGGNKPECDNPGNEVRVSGGSGGQGQGSHGDSGRGEAVNGVNTVNSETSSGPFNFDTFWKNFKSKLGFINWDAINKNQIPPPSTRALLYFHRLWEGTDASSLQKRAGSADQPGGGWQDGAASRNYNYNQQAYPTAYGWQYTAKAPAKGGVTPSSSASRAQPSLLHWVKFW